jgi:hypothetical protein
MGSNGNMSQKLFDRDREKERRRGVGDGERRE